MTRLSLEQISRENESREVTSITSLHLSLRAISDASCLSDFKNLERLDLSGNCLINLESLCSCINLKWLSVLQNKLESLKGIQGLSKLTVLNAGRNKLQTIDEIRSLTSLRALILNDNNITSICKLDPLKFLNTLVLSRNPIYDIGDSLANVKSITKLSLSHCQIQAIGSSLISCVDLKEVRFVDNKITTLPKELAQNVKIQNLDVGNNLIGSWSDLKVLSELHNLKNLNLQGNPIAEEKDKLAKKVIRKFVPNLRRFNAQSTDRGNKKEDISGADVSCHSKDDHSLPNAIDLSIKNEVKRKRNISSISEDDHALPSAINAEVENEIKRKKSKTSEKVHKINTSIPTEDDDFPGNADQRATKDLKRRKPESKEKSKFVGIDDVETPFEELVLSGKTYKDSNKKRNQESVPDAKLSGGLVVDYTKKKKGKSIGVGRSAVQLMSSISEIGIGGASTWDD